MAAARSAFEKVYRQLADDILAAMRDVYEMPDDAVQWVHAMLDYTVPGGTRGAALRLSSARLH